MRDDYYAAYREQLKEGMRIEIGIPLLAGGVFRDWALVGESHQDQLQVQISRDMLPTEVHIDEGSILDVSIWVKKEVYTCSGIVIGKSGGRVFRIRLFGPFTLRERRQFFRIALNLKLRYACVGDQGRGEVEKEWEQRRTVEQMKFQGYDDVDIAEKIGRHPPAVRLDWHELLRAEVNLGGGGLLISLPEPVHPEELVSLELHLPLTPPRQVHAVAQVIHVLKPREQKGGRFLYPAGMQFIFLDERDRDLVFRQISVAQVEHLRLLADRRSNFEQQPASVETVRWLQVAVKASWTLAALILAFFLIRYLVHYSEIAPSNQIQKTYEKAIRQYRHQE